MQDQAIEKALDESGYAQVLVVLDVEALSSTAASVAANTESDVPLTHFLDELPDTARADTAGASVAAASARETSAGTTPCRSRHYPRLGVALGCVDREGHSRLVKEPSVKETHHVDQSLSLIRPVDTRAARLSAELTWGLRKLKIQDLWAQGLTGAGVKVGHLDTGIDGEHPALRNRIAEFLEVGLDGFPVENAKPRDSGDHGTHTAGTLCGEKVDGLAFGVAPGVELYSGLVIEGNALERVLAGMEWLLEKEVRILSLSLGFRGYTPFFENIIQRLRDEGVLPLIAIGNEGEGTSRSPGNYSTAVSIGASDRSNRVARFSSSATFNRPDEPWQPNLVAPGVSVISAKPGGGVQSMDGTSMATPHAAGVAALLFEAHPDAGVVEIEHALQSTAKPLDGQQQTRFGFGLIDPLSALSAL